MATMSRANELDALQCRVDLLNLWPGASPSEVEALLRKFQSRDPDDDEFARQSTHAVPWFRVMVRACTAGTSMHLSRDISKETAMRLVRGCLGSACPSERLMKDDPYQALAVALSLTIGRLVSHKRAYHCFTHCKRKRTSLSPYGRALVNSSKAVWPPAMSPPLPAINRNREGTTPGSIITKPAQNLMMMVPNYDLVSPIDSVDLANLPDMDSEILQFPRNGTLTSGCDGSSGITLQDQMPSTNEIAFPNLSSDILWMSAGFQEQ